MSGMRIRNNEYAELLARVRKRDVAHPTSPSFDPERWRSFFAGIDCNLPEAKVLEEFGLTLNEELSKIRELLREEISNSPKGRHRGHECLVFANETGVRVEFAD